MTELDLTTVTRAVIRIRAHYDEMPGLSLTAAQAARLAGLDRALAATAMRALEDEGFLVRSWSGRFLRREHTLLRRAPLGGAGTGAAGTGPGTLPQPA